MNPIRKGDFEWWSRLVLLGTAQLLIWCWLAVLADGFTPEMPFGQRPMLLVAGLLFGSFIFYLASVSLIWRRSASNEAKKGVFLVVLGFAFLFRLPLWWSQPIQEVDLYRYLWDGRVLKQGTSPYS